MLVKQNCDFYDKLYTIAHLVFQQFVGEINNLVLLTSEIITWSVYHRYLDPISRIGGM